MVDDLYGLMDHLGLVTAAVGGLSMGGNVVLNFDAAVRRPHDSGVEVAKMARVRPLPAASARAMAETGIFRLGIPKRLGADKADAAGIRQRCDALSNT